MTKDKTTAVERLSWSPTDMVQMNGHGDYVYYTDYAVISAQLEAIHAQGYAKGLRDAAACLGHITRFEDLDAILALIPADLPAPDNRIAEYEKSYQYALNLADCLVKHYPDAVKDGWRPLGDLLGLLTQIDNMVAELIPADTPAPAKVTLGFLRPIWKDHSGEWHGPKVERWSIPEDQMVTFFNAALRAIAGEKP